MYASYYRHVVKAEKTGERDIKFTFDAPGNRELPTIVGELTVLPKHWWEGNDSEGASATSPRRRWRPPLGSGPYRIKEFVAGRSVMLERVKDYWGADLPRQRRARTISTSCVSNSSATIWLRSKPSRPIRSTGLPRTRRRMGDGLRLSRRYRKARDQGRVSRSTIPAACRASPSTCAASCSRMCGCAAPSTTRSISRK